jgi:pyrophosphate--fructose-6-phosphate 1-phosphotransferase
MPVVTFEKSNAKVEIPPMNVGVILSGGQAPGGHNVIAGCSTVSRLTTRDSRLYGFILGPGGLIDHKYMELTADIIDEYRNTGGFDMIGSGRTKLETKEQFDKGCKSSRNLALRRWLLLVATTQTRTHAYWPNTTKLSMPVYK